MIVKLNTNGKGFWTRKADQVTVIGVDVNTTYAEMIVYFDTNSWNTQSDGLIYSDPLFERELKEFFKMLGWPRDFSYSEAGMQGSDYVSFDIGGDFVAFWRNL